MQKGGDSNVGIGSFIVMCIFVLGLIAVQVYFNVRFYKTILYLENSVSEIKSKIGSLVRDINFMNQQDYKVDVEQQESINKLNMLMKM